MVGFLLAHIPWNAISNLELRQSLNALHCELLLASPSVLCNICWREYSLVVDAIKKQLPSTNHVTCALDGWTSTNNLSITLVIPDYIDRNWILRELQLLFKRFADVFFSYFEN